MQFQQFLGNQVTVSMVIMAPMAMEVMMKDGVAHLPVEEAHGDFESFSFIYFVAMIL